MKQEDVVVELQTLPTTDGVLEFEVESTFRLSSMYGVDLIAHE